MFYDLHVPWSPNDPELPRTIAFLSELGYTIIALTVTLSGKIPANHVCPIPSNPFPQYPHIRFLTRVLIILDDPVQLHGRPLLTTSYDLFTIRPTSEKVLQQTCVGIDCDLISLDLSQRMGYPLRHKTIGSAKQRGIKFEICYAGISTTEGRRNVVGNAASLIRALRGAKTGGVVISSGARRAVECRAPFDVVNLATVWGLRQEVGRDAVGDGSREVVRMAEAKRKSWRGVVEAVDVTGYEEGVLKDEADNGEGKKRKADDSASEVKENKKARKKKIKGGAGEGGGVS